MNCIHHQNRNRQCFHLEDYRFYDEMDKLSFSKIVFEIRKLYTMVLMIGEPDNFLITNGKLLLKVVKEKNERQKYVLCLENIQNAQYQPNM